MFWSRWLKPGPAHGPDLGNLGTWKSRNLESNKNHKNEIKIQIRSAQNVGKVWISRKKKTSRPHLGPSGPNFCVGRKIQKNKMKKMPIFLGVPMGPIHPVWGHVLVSFTHSFSGCFMVQNSLALLTLFKWLRHRLISSPRVDSSKGPKPVK